MANLRAILTALPLVLLAVPLARAQDAVAASAAPQAKPPSDDGLQRVQVADPYVEIRTGPGRGFPITNVAKKTEWLVIEIRHTDWFKVRTEAGKEGWVDRVQMENTLTEAGAKTSFRDVLVDDYLRRRVEFGGAWGHFSSDPVLKLWTSYNVTEIFAIEGAVGQVQGSYSGTNFWQIDLLAQPWADKRLEPFFGIGVGRIQNVPNASLVSAVTTNSNMANAMIGLRYHLGERFIARVDWTEYTSLVSANRTDQYHAVTAGLSFFF